MAGKRSHSGAMGSHTSSSSGVGIGASGLEPSDQPNLSPRISDFFRVQKRIGLFRKRVLSSDDEEEIYSGPNPGSTSSSCRLVRSVANDGNQTIDPSREQVRTDSIEVRVSSSVPEEDGSVTNLPSGSKRTKQTVTKIDQKLIESAREPVRTEAIGIRLSSPIPRGDGSNTDSPTGCERAEQPVADIGRRIVKPARWRVRFKRRIVSSDEEEEEAHTSEPNPTLPSVDERIELANDERQIAEPSSSVEDARVAISAPKGDARVTDSGNPSTADENRVRVPANNVDVDDADGQRQRLTHQLNSHSCECVICTDVIQSSYHIWPCRFCHNVFHLPCIRRWAKTNRGVGGKPNCWMCPICRHEKKCIPNRLRYNCFCGRVKKPGMKQGVTPHSCGNLCKKKCGLLCHPGPCLTAQPNAQSQ